MPANQLAFTAPIETPPLAYARIARAGDIVGSAKSLTLIFELYTAQGVRHPNAFTLLVSDVECDRLVLVDTPGSTQEIVACERIQVEDHPELTSIFERALYAYVSAQGDRENALMNLLQSVGLVFPGAATD